MSSVANESISTFTLINGQGVRMGRCGAYTYQFDETKYYVVPPSEKLVKDDFYSMCLESKAYTVGVCTLQKIERRISRSGCLNAYLGNLWNGVIGPVVGVIGIIYSIASILFHGICCIVRSIQTLDKVRCCQDKYYLDNSYKTSKDLDFLENRLSYISHRNELVGSVVLLGISILLSIFLVGTLIGTLEPPHRLKLRCRDREDKYQAQVLSFEGTKSVEEIQRDRKEMWRCPNERTLLIERITELKMQLELKHQVSQGIKNDLTDNQVVLAEGFPHEIDNLVSHCFYQSSEKTKFQYWQEKTT